MISRCLKFTTQNNTNNHHYTQPIKIKECVAGHQAKKNWSEQGDKKGNKSSQQNYLTTGEEHVWCFNMVRP
jgi:hypothetical protein